MFKKSTSNKGKIRTTSIKSPTNHTDTSLKKIGFFSKQWQKESQDEGKIYWPPKNIIKPKVKTTKRKRAGFENIKSTLLLTPPSNKKIKKIAFSPATPPSKKLISKEKSYSEGVDQQESSFFTPPPDKEKKETENTSFLSTPGEYKIKDLQLLQEISGNNDFSQETPLKKFVPHVLKKEQQFRKKTYTVFLQHALTTTASFIKEAGKKTDSKHLYYLDKGYSTNDEVFNSIKYLVGADNTIKLEMPKYPWLYGENLQEHVKKILKKVITDIEKNEEDPKNVKVIFVDDGGRLAEAAVTVAEIKEALIKYEVGDVEQTTSGEMRILGLESAPWFQRISVAMSEMKKKEEAPFIGERSTEKLMEKLANIPELKQIKKLKIGILGGKGAIGGAMINELKKRMPDAEIFFFDPKASDPNDSSDITKNATECQSAEDLIKKCQVIVGSTGIDSLKDIKNFNALITKPKHFFSTSSEAIEFESIMLMHKEQIKNTYNAKENPLANIKIMINNCLLTIYNAGYPITFDPKEKEAVSEKKISGTRALLFAAWYRLLVTQLETFNDKKTFRKPLNFGKNLQNFLSQEWKKIMFDKSKIIHSPKIKKHARNNKNEIFYSQYNKNYEQNLNIGEMFSKKLTTN